MLAERSVIIATTPGTRSLLVTTLCKTASHALLKLLTIAVPPVEVRQVDPVSARQASGGPRGTMSTVVTCGSRAPLSQRRLRGRKSRCSRSSNSDWRVDHDLARSHRPSVANLKLISSTRPCLSFLEPPRTFLLLMHVSDADS